MSPKLSDPYIPITEHPNGSYGWAMDNLRAGYSVRRMEWPIEVDRAGTFEDVGDGAQRLRTDEYVRVWKVYKPLGYSMCKGFSSNVVGADNDSWGNLGTDSDGYTPSAEDMIALDWQRASDVTDDQIAYMDERRVERIPNPIVAEHKAADDLRQAQEDRSVRILACCVGALCVYVLYLLFSR